MYGSIAVDLDCLVLESQLPRFPLCSSCYIQSHASLSTMKRLDESFNTPVEVIAKIENRVRVVEY